MSAHWLLFVSLKHNLNLTNDIYMRIFNRFLFACTAHMVRVDENGYPLTFEARSLAENQMYEFWVSASTSVGEGEPTSVVAQATNTRGR